MTEREWLACTDPSTMLEFLRGRASDRKLRLFACACVRRVWHLILPQDYEDWRHAVEKAEEHADGLLTLAELWDHAILTRLKDEMEFGKCWLFHAGAAARAASNWSDADGRWCHWRERCVGFSVEMATTAAAHAAEAAAYHTALPDWTGQDILYSGPDEGTTGPAWQAALLGEQEVQTVLVRDTIGPLPFRPVSIASSVTAWNEGTVVRLAQAAYDNRRLPEGTLDFDCLAVLADALEDAGCSDPDILTHLRGLGPHVRGCWVVDLLLEKSRGPSP
jgi:hypothetical protein